MSRVYRTQKQTEQFLIREFLGLIGQRVSAPVWTEGPDAILTLSRQKRRKRVAIEHTEYFNDTTSGFPSPRSPIEVFWRGIESSLIRRISHRTHLAGLLLTINFKPNVSLPKRRDAVRAVARQVAKELVTYSESCPTRISEWQRFGYGDFDSYPTLNSILSSLRIMKSAHGHSHAHRTQFGCTNLRAGHIGLSLEYIKSAIAKKTSKPKSTIGAMRTRNGY